MKEVKEAAKTPARSGLAAKPRAGLKAGVRRKGPVGAGAKELKSKRRRLMTTLS